MTAPANKKRTHNAAARKKSQEVPIGDAKQTKRGARRSPYGAKLQKLRKHHEESNE